MSKLNIILISIIFVLVVVFGVLLFRLSTAKKGAKTQTSTQTQAVTQSDNELVDTTQVSPAVTVKPVMRAFLKRRQAPFYAEVYVGQEVILRNDDDQNLPVTISGLITDTIELKPLEQKSITPQSTGEILFKASNGTDIEGRIVVK